MANDPRRYALHVSAQVNLSIALRGTASPDCWTRTVERIVLSHQTVVLNIKDLSNPIGISCL
jgi:hypothetical protein